jgi:hypothetical protein
MGTLAVAGFAILLKKILGLHDTGSSETALGNRPWRSAEKSMRRIEIDDCTWMGVSG